MSYNEFAYIYDRLIGQDPEQWADYLQNRFRQAGVKPELVLDLGCGTGNVTCALARRGYDMLAVDRAPDMLAVAQGKAEGLGIQFLCQDITEFELYGTVDAVVCCLDVLNYLTEAEDVLKVFNLMKNYLNPGGCFVFDISSHYKLSEVLGDNTFVAEEDGIFYVWENSYDEASRLLDSQLTFFVQQGSAYSRIDEGQTMRAYTVEEIFALLEKSGLQLLGVYDGIGTNAPAKNSERLSFLTKRIC